MCAKGCKSIHLKNGWSIFGLEKEILIEFLCKFKTQEKMIESYNQIELSYCFPGIDLGSCLFKYIRSIQDLIARSIERLTAEFDHFH